MVMPSDVRTAKVMSRPCTEFARAAFLFTESKEIEQRDGYRTAKRRQSEGGRRFANFIIFPIMKFFAALSFKKERVPFVSYSKVIVAVTAT